MLDQARELYLPTPSLNDKSKWVSDEEFAHTGARYWILTPEAMIELIGAIRKGIEPRIGVFVFIQRSPEISIALLPRKPAARYRIQSEVPIWFRWHRRFLISLLLPTIGESP